QATMNGFMLPVVLATGHSGQVTIAFKVGAFQTGTVDVAASVSEAGGSGEVLGNVFFTRIPLAPCAFPTPGPTQTPVIVVPSTSTPTAVVPGLTQTPPAATAVPPTPTNTPAAPAPTNTSIPPAAAIAPSATPVVPPSATPVVPVSPALAIPPSATP